ncbi:hypothetical protein DYB32_010437, partial [Aphanomyces invadans]
MWKRSHETMTHHPMIERADLPYGDSQLTRLLEPSLGPHASLAMLCTISPSLPCLTETHNTLKFASRWEMPSLAPSDDDGDSSAWDDPDSVPPSDNGTALEDNAAVHAATLDLLRRNLDPDDASMLLHGLLPTHRALFGAASSRGIRSYNEDTFRVITSLEAYAHALVMHQRQRDVNHPADVDSSQSMRTALDTVIRDNTMDADTTPPLASWTLTPVE